MAPRRVWTAAALADLEDARPGLRSPRRGRYPGRMGAAAKLQTFDEMMAEIAALPEGQHGEILGPGVWRAMGRPGGPHSRVAKRLVRAVGGIDLDAGGAWWIEPEREVRLFGRLYVPDLAGWRVSDGDVAFADDNPITRIPDWACEILSRSTQRADRIVKLPTYADAGVGHVWIVDLEARTIEVYETVAGRPTLVAGVTSLARVPPFDLDIDVEALFAPPLSRTPAPAG